MSRADLTDIAIQREEFRAARRDLMLLGYEESRLAAIEKVARVIDEADDLGAEGTGKVMALAQNLQDKRAFGLMLVLCVMAARAQLGSAALLQKEIQALIELGRLAEAIRRAKTLEAGTASAEPGSEEFDTWKSALGNLGRAFKQSYMNAVAAQARGEGPGPSAADLEQAVSHYKKVWDRTRRLHADRPELNVSPSTYHAINSAALTIRAERDRARLPTGSEEADEFEWASGEWARGLAEDILRQHQTELKTALGPAVKKSDMWTLATCGEAYLVLGYDEDAALCYGAFAGNPDNDAFKIASALRQLEEVWEISGDEDSMRGGIVRLLKASLIAVNKGPDDAEAQAAEDTIQTEPVILSPTEASLLRRDLERTKRETPTADAKASPDAASGAGHDTPSDGFQAFFEKRGKSDERSGQMMEIDRILGAVQRVRSICAIETIKDGDWEQIGSGFVIDGGVFRPDWAGQPLIATNHHVVGDRDGVLGASYLRSRAVFYEHDTVNQVVEPRPVTFEAAVWFSPRTQHDITLLKPKTDLPSCALALGSDDVSDYLPPRPAGDVDGCGYHVVVLGFPLGGEAKLSFDDELLLDHSVGEPGVPARSAASLDGRPERLHYRTPTQPGSSGSPVFDSGSWKLMGIHHMGSPSMARIPTKTGQYEANQGIWLASIRAAINAPDAILGDPANGEAGGEPAEFLPISSGVFGAMAGREGSTDFPNASAARPPARTGDDVVMGKPLGPPGSGDPGVAKPPSRLIIPGRRIRHPDDDAGLLSRLLKSGHFDGNLDTFRARSAGFETVIGDDNRTQIHATTAYPFRLICSLTMHWEGGTETVGTGFLVGQRTVLTAGHCILPSQGSPYPVGIEIRPGRSGGHEPYSHFGQLYAEKISLHREWSNRFDPRFDIGALHLNREIGEELGWFRVAARDPDTLARQWVHVTGYPGDKFTTLSAELGGDQLHAAEQWHHATPVETIHDGRVYYPADTFGGQSGSPVYTYDEDGEATVIGVHAYGIGSGAGAFAYENNSAGWVDAGLLQVISDWRTL